MLGQWIRTLLYHGSALRDYSLDLQRADGNMPIPLVFSTDAIYLGQYFPFNNFFVEMEQVNSKTSALSIQYWDGSDFRDAVDLLDGTSLNSKTLNQSGIVQFQPSRDYAWNYMQDPVDDGPSPLNTVRIEDLYWLKLKFSANTSGKIKNISYAFCRHEDLVIIDPEINDYLSAWQQDNWTKQILLASQNVVADLKARGLVKNNGQILRFDEVFLATVYKTLDIIFTPMGKNFVDKRKDYQKKYQEFIQGPRFTFDQTNDARVERCEIQNSTHMGVR
jgi:hypothetical protein